MVECKFLLISKFSAPCFERSWNTFIQRYSSMLVVQMVWPVTTINKWDHGGSRLPFLATLSFKQFFWVQEAGMGWFFYNGNFKKCNSGFAIFSWVTTILGLFATLTLKSVHESVMTLWMGWYSVLSKDLFLGWAPTCWVINFKFASIVWLTSFVQGTHGWVVTLVPMLCGYLLWGGLESAISVLVRGTYLELVPNFGTDSFPMISF